jgi:hypothetical protein
MEIKVKSDKASHGYVGVNFLEFLGLSTKEIFACFRIAGIRKNSPHALC